MRKAPRSVIAMENVKIVKMEPWNNAKNVMIATISEECIITKRISTQSISISRAKLETVSTLISNTKNHLFWWLTTQKPKTSWLKWFKKNSLALNALLKSVNHTQNTITPITLSMWYPIKKIINLSEVHYHRTVNPLS